MARYQPRAQRHLELRHRTYLAVLEIPPALRPKFPGKKGKPKARFIKSLETDSIATAERRAAPLIAEWRRQIAAARTGANHDDPMDGGGLIDEAADAEYLRRALHAARTEAERREVLSVAADHADMVAAMSTETEGVYDAAAEAAAGAFYASATAVPFDAYLEEWLAPHGAAPRTKAVMAHDVRRFAAAFPTIAEVSKAAVKRWADTLLAGGLARGTVQRIMSAVRGYWRHLQSIEAVPEGHEPFTGLHLAQQGGRVVQTAQRQAFTPADVVKLLLASQSDPELAAVIDMARYTGARIEELCSLRIADIHLHGPIPYLGITAGKTSAAIRQIPIHTKLLPVVAGLVKGRREGFLLPALPVNKYGDRSPAISKRFGRLKGRMGFGAQHVFHSIRKTVATMLKDASVPEATAADLLGHDIPTMSYGVYAGGVSLATKAEAIALLRYPTG